MVKNKLQQLRAAMILSGEVVKHDWEYVIRAGQAGRSRVSLNARAALDGLKDQELKEIFLECCHRTGDACELLRWVTGRLPGQRADAGDPGQSLTV